MQRGPQGRVRLVLPGTRAVEEPEAQHHTAPGLANRAACCSAASAERKMTATSPTAVSSDPAVG